MGAIDELQLRSALAHQQQWGAFLGKTLVELGFCSWADVMRALSIQTGHPLVDLDSLHLAPEVRALLPATAAQKLRAVPIGTEGKRSEVLIVAVAAPAPMDVQDSLRAASKKIRVKVQLASDTAITAAIDELYNGIPRNMDSAPVVLPPQVGTESLFEMEADEPPPPNAPPVSLFGWNSARERALKEMLRLVGITAAPVEDGALTGPGEEVLLVSTLGVQAYLPAGQKIPSSRAIVLGQSDDLDMEDARALGARMYLRPPFSPEKLRQAILKLQGQA